LAKGLGRLRSVEGPVAEHCEEGVGSAAGEAEEGLGVVLALGDSLVVVGLGGRGGERGVEEGPS
jgi:hypothetical protein